jgi:hypothetical protein
MPIRAVLSLTKVYSFWLQQVRTELSPEVEINDLVSFNDYVSFLGSSSNNTFSAQSGPICWAMQSRMNWRIFCEGVVSSKSQITSKILFFLGSTNKVNRAVRFSIACGSVQLAKGIPPYAYLIIFQLTLNYNNLNNLPRAVFLRAAGDLL